MELGFAFGLIVLLMAVGLIERIVRIREVRHSFEFTKDYHAHWGELITALNKREFDSETYHWLNYHSAKMERELGDAGRISYTPMVGVMSFVNNYSLIPNVLSAVQGRQVEPILVNALLNALERHAGELSDIGQQASAELRNPLHWLKRGLIFVISLPTRLLYWAGILGYNSFEQAAHSSAGRFINSVVWLVSVVGTLVGLVVDWSEFTSWFCQTFCL